MPAGRDLSDIAGSQERGLYTLTDSDMKTIDSIEMLRLQYEMSLDGMSEDERIESLSAIINSMKIFMRSYNFEAYLNATKVDGYTFFDVEKSIELTEGDPELVHKCCDIAFTMWKNVLRKLGVGLPTYHENTKKKILESVFGMAYGDIDDEKFIQEYHDAVEYFGGHDSNFKFFSYVVSRLHEFDLPFDMTWIGPARSSKSTGACDFIEMGYLFRGVDFYGPMPDGVPFFANWVDNRCIYDQQQGINAIKSSHSDYNLFDEGFKTNDKRRSMHGKQIDMTGEGNWQASKRSININLIQMFEDFDIRTKGKSQATIINIGRGKGLLFCDSKVIAIARDVLFEKFTSDPKMLRFTPFAIHMLKREASYVCEIAWKERGAYADDFGNVYCQDADPYFAYYLQNKVIKQNEVKQREAEKEEMKVKIKAPSKIQQIREMFSKGMARLDIARNLHVAPSYVSNSLSSA